MHATEHHNLKGSVWKEQWIDFLLHENILQSQLILQTPHYFASWAAAKKHAAVQPCIRTKSADAQSQQETSPRDSAHQEVDASLDFAAKMCLHAAFKSFPSSYTAIR